MDVLREFEGKCGTTIAKLRQVADAMTEEMHVGLASDGGGKLNMLINYVDNLPTGMLCPQTGHTIYLLLWGVLDVLAQAKNRHSNGWWPAKSAKFILDLLETAKSDAKVHFAGSQKLYSYNNKTTNFYRSNLPQISF
ncbi:LOW QUALITY PROTEIN: hypothetical protein M8C21_022059, partial [Ambrosia artemisiifolia]